jgi:hypothetical protein
VSPANNSEVPRCPYCASGIQFRPRRILEKQRQICESCGHIVFPEDRAFLSDSDCAIFPSGQDDKDNHTNNDEVERGALLRREDDESPT